MAQGSSDLWKQAYRTQFGTDADQDMAEHRDDVEAWRVNWQGGYDAGEDWAKNMLQPQGGGNMESSAAGNMQSSSGNMQQNAGGQMGQQQAANPMRTFDDMGRQNARIREQYDSWRDQRAAQGQDATDWDAFRQHLTSQGSPDPGGRPPDDFVGEDWKAQNPEWVQRYGNRVA